MIKWIFRILVFLNPVFALGQAGTWVFLKGDTNIAYSGVYGIRGVADSANHPQAFYEPVEWTDLNGNFWLFGGVSGGGGIDEYAVLWKYEPATNNWTWMKGSTTANHNGYYGTLGVPATINNPPARAWGACSWTDLSGDLWLYGGAAAGGSPGGFADLWRYNIASNMWTWVNGPSGLGQALPVYGIQGIPAANNQPGMRQETSATWVDANNNLWLFGGGNRNDLWRYNIAANQWTWMKGADTANQHGVYGTKGVEAAVNVPGARDAYASWSDWVGNLWLFGGRGGAVFNDMWKYDLNTNNWTWMSGTNMPNDSGTYGALCSPSANFAPRARFENRARWKDRCGNFWMYGGFGINANNSDNYLSDLWCFNPFTLEWTLASGSAVTDINPTYGNMGVPSAANFPGGRAGAVGWASSEGDLYLFGGWARIKKQADLWKFVIDTSCMGSNYCNHSCALSPPHLAVNDTIICSGDSIQICLSQNFNVYNWNNGASANCIYVAAAGNYYVTVTGDYGCTAESNRVAIGVHSPPPVLITVSGDTLTAYNAIEYQWLLNGNKIDSAVSNIYLANLAGSYTVQVKDSNGCSAVSNAVIVTGIIGDNGNVHFSIYPNPATNQLTVSCDKDLLGAQLNIYNSTGSLIHTTQITTTNLKIETISYPFGIYIAQVKLREKAERIKWVKL